MTKVLAFIMLSVFFLYYMSQPEVERTLQYRDQVLQKKANQMAHLAALEGRLSPEIKEQVLSDLDDLYFDRDSVKLEGPDTVSLRGEVMDVSLRYPQGPTQIFDLFGTDEARDYYYPISIMSEYLEP
ncbi:hypothetical protein HUB94_20265 (plasmid) [Paenibacillus cellulosilyticus]|nr:hypothetical protein [Paenibacillus cellulosilyticus]QKS46820.1 hypothetical protein HUB94_20265 [Paenibacillus cellulosilyticus]